MKKILKLAEKLINSIENSEISFIKWLASFTAVIIARILVENWISGFGNKSPLFIFYEFTHNFLFFAFSFLLFVFLLNKILKTSIAKLSNVMLWGFLIIITPPIIDNIISKGKGLWSFYKFDSISGLIKRFLTFFGDKPEIGITYGVRFEVAIVILLLFVYVFIKVRRKKKNLAAFAHSIMAAFLAYTLFFILGTFPSYITIFFEGIRKGFMKVSEADIAGMFLSPSPLFFKEITEMTSVFNLKMSLIYVIFLSLISITGLFFYWKDKFLSFVKNARFPQVVYHIGLLSVGLALGIITNYKETSFSINSYLTFFNVIGFLILVESTIMAWLASVVINDIVDKKIDEKTNNSRPLIKKSLSENEYVTIGIMLFMLSLLFSSIVNFKFMLFLIVYQAIAWIYSSWPMRLKRFTFVSTFVSSIASLMIFFGGFTLMSPNQNLSSLPKPIIILLIVGYTLSLPIKDFKDIEGDKEDKVYTIPVVFGEYWGKIIVGSGIFLSFVLSAIIINEPKLFWWAIILGGISFWLVADTKKDPKALVHYRNIFWWILTTVSVYGIILVKLIFL